MTDNTKPIPVEEKQQDETPLKNDGNDEAILIRPSSSFGVLLWRPVAKSWYYSVSGLVGASLVGSYGGFLFHMTLYAEAIFVLGPMGAAQGLLQACREIVLDSGLAARMGRRIYQQALQVMQDDEHASQNMKQALEHLRESFPMAESILAGQGWTGYVTQTVLGLFLPNVGEIFRQVENVMEWSEEHEQELADTEIVARATTSYIARYLDQKEGLVTTVGAILYITIAGVSLFMSAGVGYLFE